MLHHTGSSSRCCDNTTFVTLYEAYMGIDPQLNLCNNLFCVRCPHDPDTELTVSRGTIVHVKYRHGVDPYFDIPMPTSTKGWRKKWFYLRNDASALLPAFTGCRPVPLSSLGGGGVAARRDLGKLQSMHEVLQ
jgi:hypothetical protein